MFTFLWDMVYMYKSKWQWKMA